MTREIVIKIQYDTGNPVDYMPGMAACVDEDYMKDRIREIKGVLSIDVLSFE